MLRRTYDSFTVRAEGDDAPVTSKTVADAINAAIAEFSKTLPNVITSTIQPLIEPLRVQTPTPQQTPQTSQTSQNQPQLPPEVAQQLHRLTEENKAIKQQFSDMSTREKNAQAAAEKSDRENKIRTAMGNYAFASDNARESAFRLLDLDIQRTEQGVLVGPNNLPLEDYVKDSLLKTHDYLLAPVDTTGTGAARGVTRQASSVGIETIKPDMTESDRTAVVQEITRAVNAAQAA